MEFVLSFLRADMLSGRRLPVARGGVRLVEIRDHGFSGRFVGVPLTGIRQRSSFTLFPACFQTSVRVAAGKLL